MLKQRCPRAACAAPGLTGEHGDLELANDGAYLTVRVRVEESVAQVIDGVIHYELQLETLHHEESPARPLARTESPRDLMEQLRKVLAAPAALGLLRRDWTVTVCNLSAAAA